MTAQILEIAGQQMAVLPIEDYRRLLEAVEDNADEKAAEDAVQRRMAGEEYVPVAMVDRILAGESALKIWREYRGMSGTHLAKLSGVNAATVSKLEHGHRLGRPAVWRALAEALGVAPDDIMPLV